MINDVSSALNAYQQALGRLSGMTQAKSSVAAEETKSSSDFGQVLSSVIDEAVGTVKNAEKMSMQGIAGKADVQDVVLAISNAEQTLDTVVALRDSAIKAYREIIQMTI